MHTADASQRADSQPTFFGLGHALRKQAKFEAAEEAYRRALGLVPRSASTLVALAFTAQLRGDNTTAVELYHVALGLRPDDGYVTSGAAEQMRFAMTPRAQVRSRNAHRGAEGRMCCILSGRFASLVACMQKKP